MFFVITGSSIVLNHFWNNCWETAFFLRQELIFISFTCRKQITHVEVFLKWAIHVKHGLQSYFFDCWLL